MASLEEAYRSCPIGAVIESSALGRSNIRHRASSLHVPDDPNCLSGDLKGKALTCAFNNGQDRIYILWHQFRRNIVRPLPLDNSSKLDPLDLH